MSVFERKREHRQAIQRVRRGKLERMLSMLVRLKELRNT
jgi:hypothetical protein